MGKITGKKDFKLLISIFSTEIVLLLICFVIANAKTKPDLFVGSTSYEGFVNSMNSINKNILENSFNGYGIGGFNSLYEKKPGSNIQNPNTPDILYKYYTFNLSDSGITSNLTKAKPDSYLMSGITSNTATNTVVKSAKSTFQLGSFKIHNDYVYENLDLTEILAKPLVIEPMDNSQILIYHVHATEGYCRTEADKADLNNYSREGEYDNVVAAGNILERTINSCSGIKTIHDKTVFKEGMQSSVVYGNAAKKLDEIYAENKNVKLQIDVHRNSATYQGKKYGPVVEADGVKYAQFSFVIGLDWDPSTGVRSDSVNPYWEDNFKLCMIVMEKLNKKVPGIVRQIDLRRNPYNQGYVENSLLVEIGFDGNLTSEADASAKLLGEVLSDIYG